ncbi:hypothetical protein [Mycobacterium avium]
MSGGFDLAAEALRGLAEGLSGIADAVSRPPEQWLGAAGDAYAESMAQVAQYLRTSASDLADAAESCGKQVGVDAELMKAPTTDDLADAAERVAELRAAAVSGAATPAELMAAVREYQTMEAQREEALDVHEQGTQGLELPTDHPPLPEGVGGDVCAPGFGDIGGDGEPLGRRKRGDDTGDATAGDTGETVAGGADEGVPDTDMPADAPVSDAPASVSPSQTTGTGSAPTSTPSLSDTAAGTELSTDAAATLSPQAGSLGATPMQQQQPQQISGGGAPGFTTAGTALGQPSQAAPPRAAQQQQQRREVERGDDGKLTEGGLGALLGHTATGVAAGVTGAAVTGGGSPAPSAPTAPSNAGAPTAPAAPTGTTPPPSNPTNPGAVPTAGPGGAMLGSGAGVQKASATPKPEAPKPPSGPTLDEALKAADAASKSSDQNRKAS